MSENESTNFDRDHVRKNLLSFTRKAFEVLPRLDNPEILDIACGTGVVTRELVRLSGGNITAVDIDQRAIDKLKTNAQSEGIIDRIRIVNCPAEKMDFPESNFDIIWSEGIIPPLDFEYALEKWQRFLKTEGHMVIHGSIPHVDSKKDSMNKYGFSFLKKIDLTPDIWWDNYYAPLKEELVKLNESAIADQHIKSEIHTAKQEIEAFDTNSQNFTSVFIIMQKRKI